MTSKTKLYFSHPVSDFGTEYEAQVVTHLVNLGYDVVNPNSPEHQAGYAERGFAYTKEVRAGCDACAFLRFPTGCVGAGVANEVASFIKLELPVFEMMPDMILVQIRGVPGNILGNAATNLETDIMKGRPNGGRGVAPVADAAE